MSPLHDGRHALPQRGMVLITTLLLLVVVTILALAMFRGIGLENRIAGNTLDKQRALQAADSTQEYAEEWLLNNILVAPLVNCAQDAQATATPEICTEPLVKQVDGGQVANPPWTINGTEVGFTYTADITTSQSGGQNTLYRHPRAYVGLLGADNTYAGAKDYTVDAWSYGGSSATIAVVESTYQVRPSVVSATNP